MKKLLVVLLALATIFAFAACGEQAESDTASESVSAVILGEGIPEYDISQFGDYVEVEPTEAMLAEEADQTLAYYDENSDTPYIVIYRWAKNGATLEEETAACADEASLSGYQMTEWSEGIPCGYYCCSSDVNGKFYFIDCWMVEDGDDFVEIDFLGASEELQLGESNNYLWVPSGYEDYEIPEEDAAMGELLHAVYPDNYDFPRIWVGKYDTSYKWFQWYWSQDYPDGKLPLDEAAYNKVIAKEEWTDEDYETLYGTMGYKDIDFVMNQDGVFYNLFIGEWEDYHCNEACFVAGEDMYILYTDTQDIPNPRFSREIVESLHTK